VRKVPIKVAASCESLDSPTFIYYIAYLIDNARAFRRSFPCSESKVLFATMANPRSEILRALAQEEIGACVNSIAHLNAARDAGIPARDIQFTSSGITSEDMRRIVAAGVDSNLDSLGQIEQFFRKTSSRKCGVRVSTRSLLGGAFEASDRLGIAVGELGDAVNRARELGGQVSGAHVYVGTNFQSHHDMLPALDAFFEAVQKLPDISYVNVGGGIGVDYGLSENRFDVNRFGSYVESRMDKLRQVKARSIRLFVEPGRSLVASCGYFACRVTDIKRLGGRRFVVVDASVAQFPRPWHHPETPHTVIALDTSKDRKCDSAIVVGRTTYSNDVLAQPSLPVDLDIGEVLVFFDAGAYCDSMSSRFLGQAAAKQVFVE
jgi:diaminopimelate decarboxylase